MSNLRQLTKALAQVAQFTPSPFQTSLLFLEASLLFFQTGLLIFSNQSIFFFKQVGKALPNFPHTPHPFHQFLLTSP